MGSYDGAQVCELVGLFLLHELNTLMTDTAGSLGLYRDDGLAAVYNLSGSAIDRLKKDITKIFQTHGLSLTTETNLIQTDFLDVTFNLETEKFWSYRKPGDQPLYINMRSNHPPNIKKQLPKMVESRLSMNSCDEDAFKNAAPNYEKAWKDSGYSSTKLQFVRDKLPAKKNRKRKILWFNPPFNSAVITNIDKEFFRLLQKHFPSHHQLHKICNKNSVKLNYCCTPNIKSIITGHYNKLLHTSDNPKRAAVERCKCRSPYNCPLDDNCCVSSVVYKATLTSSNPPKKYYGCCSTSFKTRYSNHKQSFLHQQKKSTTELSKAYWELKEEENGRPLDISWSIVRHARPYNCGTRRCNLCLEEKLTILLADPTTTLNKRSELVAKCRHSNKFKLRNVK